MGDCMQDVRFVPSTHYAEDSGKMKSADDFMRERDQLGAQLAEIEGLVAALAVIAWQIGQVDATGEMHQLRNAVIGISRALDREIARSD